MKRTLALIVATIAASVAHGQTTSFTEQIAIGGLDCPGLDYLASRQLDEAVDVASTPIESHTTGAAIVGAITGAAVGLASGGEAKDALVGAAAGAAIGAMSAEELKLGTIEWRDYWLLRYRDRLFHIDAAAETRACQEWQFTDFAAVIAPAIEAAQQREARRGPSEPFSLPVASPRMEPNEEGIAAGATVESCYRTWERRHQSTKALEDFDKYCRIVEPNN